MLIESLRLTSFKGFKDFEVKCSPFTGVVGPNSGGKTSILQAIKLLHELVVFAFGNRSSPTFPNVQWQTNPSQVLQRVAAGDQDAVWLNKRTSEPCKLTAWMSGGVEVRLELLGPSNYSLDVLEDSTSLRKSINQPDSQRVIEDLFALRPIYVPPVGTISPSERFQAKPELDQQLNQGRAAEHWRLSLYWLWNDGKQEDYEKVVALVQQHLPDAQILPPRLTHANPPEVVVEFQKGDTRFNISTGGGGLRSLLNVAAVLQFSGSKCLLFDEPDAHLHGTLQRQMSEMLQSYAADKDIQVFVATHAPDFIAEVPTDSLVWIDRQESSGRQCTGLGEFLVGLGSLSKADALRSCGADKLLFLEGQLNLDRRVFERLWQQSSYQNPFADPSVLKARLPDGRGHRTHLATVQRVLKDTFGLGMKVAAVTDADYDLNAQHEDDTGREDQPLLLCLGRKEVENYLIETAVILPAWQQLAEKRKPKRDVPDAQELLALLDGFMGDPQVKGELEAQLVPRYQDSLDAKLDAATRYKKGREWFEKQWNDPAWRLRHVPGKRVLRRLREWSQTALGLTLTDAKLIAELKQLPSDLERLAQALDVHLYG